MNPSPPVSSSSDANNTASILLELVQNPKNLGWTKKRKGWDEDTDVCEWDGISCNENHELITLNLENTNLITTIPTSLARLTTLQHLLLANNKIYGTLPPSLFRTSKKKISSLFKSLTTASLLFGGNDDDVMSGGTIGLTNLVALDLSFNGLRGSIPKIRNDKLEVVNLRNNQLSGTLGEDTFGAAAGVVLENLKILDLVNNYLGGTLPNSLTAITTLVELNLSKNRFHGSIPDDMGRLSKLEGLFLDNNNLVGSIPPSLTREYLPLKQLFLHSNNLSGSLPLGLADLKHLENLFIVDNKFTGTIPNELCQKNLNSQFSHTTTTHHDDKCHTIACPPTYRSSTTDRNGVTPCTPCDDGSHNPYLGSNSCYDVKPEIILANFYYATNGENWDDDGGETWVDRDVSICGRRGIICDSNGNVVEMRLEGMNLSGSIPEDVGFLRHLKVLSLSDNNLYGTIPSSLQFPPLATLDISGNKLQGFIPPQLCSKAGINQNGRFGILDCDIIACPVGTHHPVTGYADADDARCHNCRKGGALYLGSKTCKSRTTHDVAVATTLSSTRTDADGDSYSPSSPLPIFNLGLVLILFSIVTAGTITYILYSCRKVEKEETFDEKRRKRLSVVAPSQLRKLSFAIPQHPTMSISRGGGGRTATSSSPNRLTAWMDSFGELDMIHEIEDCEVDHGSPRGQQQQHGHNNEQVWLDVPQFH